MLLQHYEVLKPVLTNKAIATESRDIRSALQPQSHTNYFSQYGLEHNKLGAMLDMSKPKYEIPLQRPLPRQYSVLTGKGYYYIGDLTHEKKTTP